MKFSSLQRSIASLVCLGLTTTAHAQLSDRIGTLSRLEPALTQMLAETHTAGFAVAVVEKNKVVYAKGFGYRDQAARLPVTPDTRFAIGSCTKSFTSALLGNLRQQGKVDFDKPATTYLPALHFNNPDLDHQLTLRDMMCHRTGYSRYDMAWYLFGTDSRDTLLKRMYYMKPDCPLRARWQYNNFMFMVQGMVTEQLTGKSWEQNISSQIFEPLDMQASSIGTVALAAAPERSLGYEVDDKNTIKEMKYHPITAMGPAGAINSTVMDMSKWLITWINGGTYNKKEILPASYVKDAISSQMVVSGNLPDSKSTYSQFLNYGFAWMLFSYRGHYRVEHGGNIDGFTALMAFYPTDSIGIVVLSNQQNSPVPTLVTDLVSDHLMGINTTKREKPKPKQNDGLGPEKDSTFTPHPASHPLSAFAGQYKNDAYGYFDLYVKNDSLYARFPYITWYLYHENYDIFSPFNAADSVIDVKYKSNMRVQFLLATTGEVDQLQFSFDPAGGPVIFDRVGKTVTLSPDTLRKFTGQYKSEGFSITIKLAANNVLQVYVPGQPTFTLEAEDGHLFRVKELKNYKLNFEEEGDQVTAVKLMQPNGTFRADRVKEEK
ncbi:CubicO group peptidase (beta-lactamase class C family) [Chitinophaga polysaccharea]|uniref:CubicO group peptidase (Beta-lactamase class C family) n=1 Tax=Chitinophaga polysaccharea TaxID=1293035 RepID=A0A561PTI0_9BACT|nr:serine hydrolase [Chitinophaga polysaccharea]TWF41393.1 CubicO group peptidase (beta-lactamase class C family) [Chitinophaga polysaccharea]